MFVGPGHCAPAPPTHSWMLTTWMPCCVQERREAERGSAWLRVNARRTAPRDVACAHNEHRALCSVRGGKRGLCKHAIKPKHVETKKSLNASRSPLSPCATTRPRVLRGWGCRHTIVDLPRILAPTRRENAEWHSNAAVEQIRVPLMRAVTWVWAAAWAVTWVWAAAWDRSALVRRLETASAETCL